MIHDLEGHGLTRVAASGEAPDTCSTDPEERASRQASLRASTYSYFGT